jgi:hypothetical protein
MASTGCFWIRSVQNKREITINGNCDQRNEERAAGEEHRPEEKGGIQKTKRVIQAATDHACGNYGFAFIPGLVPLKGFRCKTW